MVVKQEARAVTDVDDKDLDRILKELEMAAQQEVCFRFLKIGLPFRVKMTVMRKLWEWLRCNVLYFFSFLFYFSMHSIFLRKI